MVPPLLRAAFLVLAVLSVTSSQNVRRKQLSEQPIVGGRPASAGDYPWFVAFEPMVWCGGSLIAPDRVLTAAHCVVSDPPSSVRIGPTSLNDGESRDVSCATIHPDFNVGPRGDLFNDIAIIKLSEPFSSATPIKLNNDTNYPSEVLTPLTVIGFGATSEGGRVSSVLRQLDTYFETIENCQEHYPDVEVGTHVCGDVDFEGDCQGDSGGPLFDKNGTQIGVVSYGLGCARNPYQDVYAGVAKHYDWIQSQMQNDECTFYPPSFFGRIVRFMSRTVQNFGLAVGNFILNILF